MTYWSTCPLHIRYADTDQMGVVHNSVYAVYCEIGRTHLCKENGVPYHEMEEDGIYMMVAEMTGRFHKAIRYGESVRIRTGVVRMKRRLMTFQYEIFNENTGDLTYTGTSTHLFSRDRKKTCDLPEKYYRLLSNMMGISDK